MRCRNGKLPVSPAGPCKLTPSSIVSPPAAPRVSTALDAVGHQGRVTITATTRGDSIVVRVADDGPGIPEAIRARVFDPFFTTKPVGHGTGLGLDLARRIVHLHRGDIDFSTQPGRTVFRVRLPAEGAKVMAGGF